MPPTEPVFFQVCYFTFTAADGSMSDTEPPRKCFCGHCNEYHSTTVYFQHKRLYFNKESNKWLPTQVFSKSSSSDEQDFRPKSTVTPRPSAVLTAADCGEVTCHNEDIDGMHDDTDSADLMCIDPDDDEVSGICIDTVLYL